MHDDAFRESTTLSILRLADRVEALEGLLRELLRELLAYRSLQQAESLLRNNMFTGKADNLHDCMSGPYEK